MNNRFILKIKNSCCVILRAFAENPLCTIAFSFLIVLALGVFIFYRYYVLAEFSELKTTGKTLEFQEELYRQVLKKWQERDERLESAGSQKYLDPFQRE
ncbi:hypothetical protein KKG51_05240 [Patescibacteria group bacterium]|nr:hypothetical protein [Patescibacteria group bacterium]